MEPGADRGDRRGVLVGDREARADRDRALDEQPDRRVLAERDQVDRPVPAAARHPLDARIRWLGSGGAGRPGTAYSCSPETCRTARLVDDRLDARARARSRSATIGAAATTCSKLSRTSRRRLSRSQSASDSCDRAGRALGDAERARDPRRDEHRIADRLERHEEDAVGEVVRAIAPRAGARAASCRSRPARSASAAGSLPAAAAASSSSASRPTNVVSWVGRLFGPGVERRGAAGSRPAGRRRRPGRSAPAR